MSDAEWVKSLRSELGISQEQLAHNLGVSQTFVNYVENEQAPLPARLRHRLSVLAATLAMPTKETTP